MSKALKWPNGSLTWMTALDIAAQKLGLRGAEQESKQD